MTEYKDICVRFYIPSVQLDLALHDLERVPFLIQEAVMLLATKAARKEVATILHDLLKCQEDGLRKLRNNLAPLTEPLTM